MRFHFFSATLFLTIRLLYSYTGEPVEIGWIVIVWPSGKDDAIAYFLCPSAGRQERGHGAAHNRHGCAQTGDTHKMPPRDRAIPVAAQLLHEGFSRDRLVIVFHCLNPLLNRENFSRQRRERDPFPPAKEHGRVRPSHARPRLFRLVAGHSPAGCRGHRLPAGIRCDRPERCDG